MGLFLKQDIQESSANYVQLLQVMINVFYCIWTLKPITVSFQADDGLESSTVENLCLEKGSGRCVTGY